MEMTQERMALSSRVPRRFFFHYNKHTGNMTVHVNKRCIPVRNVVCQVPVSTKYNTRQPRLVMQGFATVVEILGDLALIR